MIRIPEPRHRTDTRGINKGIDQRDQSGSGQCASEENKRGGINPPVVSREDPVSCRAGANAICIPSGAPEVGFQANC